MDDSALALIFGLLVLAALVAMLVLPIVALVVSIRTRKKLNQTISRLESGQAPSSTSTPASLAGVVQQLTIRVARLEAAITGQPFEAPKKVAAPITPPPIKPPPVAAQ